MKPTLREMREARKQRMNRQSKLNLTSLMDIFTILVFFLMVNSSDVQVLENSKSITMPTSLADQKPKETLLLQVDDKNIVLAGRTITSSVSVDKSAEDLIEPLMKELTYQASRRPELTKEEKEIGRSITIQGDKDIPYNILKKLMATSAKAGFRDISLAVSKQVKKAAQGG